MMMTASDRIPSRRQQQVSRLRRTTIGIISACAATCASAFTWNHQPFLRVNIRHQQLQLLPQRPSRFFPRQTVQLWLAINADVSPAQADDAEWKALVLAFQMYKAAYGDLKVPSRFIVPSMPPWPEKAWNMKLGQKVAAIRSTGKHVQNNEKRRKQLESLGFLWRLRATSPEQDMDGVTLDQIYDALVMYRKEHPSGTLSVPPNFVVPDCDPWPVSTRGLPLGKNIAAMRSRAFQKANPEVEQKLILLGLEMDSKTAANDSRFDTVYDALKRYKEIYGDLLVAQPFSVPENSEDWPEHTWGLRLGARVNAIRSQGTFVNTNPERRQDLDDIGFIWSPPSTERGKKRGRRSKAEIEAEDEAEDEDMIENDLDVSISENTAWDTTGAAMENIFGPSFDFGLNDPFKNENGTPSWGIDVATMSSEPMKNEEPPQPESVYVMPQSLGKSLSEARARAIAVGIIVDTGNESLMKKGKQMKEIPWYNDDFGDNFVFDDVVEALAIYKSMYGDFANFTIVEGCDFVVPSPSSDFFGEEEDTSSFDKKASSRAAAAIAAYKEEEYLEESENLIALEIKRLKREVLTPVSMQTLEEEVVTKLKPVARGNIFWPEYLSGMQLGSVVKRIREGSLEVKHVAERKEQLDDIGFDWGNERYFMEIPFEKAMCAFFAYYLVRGDMFVYEDFIMPDEDPWPEALAGYEIGKSVKRIRELQNFMETYHPEKVSLLRAIDFIWFPTLALPLDPEEAEMTAELRMLISSGHPDYTHLPNPPPGIFEKLLADGPFFETDDPKQMWRRYHNFEYVKDHWYANGCRDNAYRLRQAGYTMLATEHEAKYGPGLYKQIDTVFAELSEGAGRSSDDTKQKYLDKLQFFRKELVDSTDLERLELNDLTQRIDNAMLLLMTSKERVTTITADSFADSGFGRGIGGDYDEFEEESIEDDLEGDDIDIEDELGLADVEEDNEEFDDDDDFGSSSSFDLVHEEEEMTDLE